MERRSLLVGLATLVVSPASVLASNVCFSADRFRLAPGGRIMVRGTEGWSESIILGDDIQVLSIIDAGTGGVLTASHAGQQFQLRTADGHRWQVV